MIRICIAIILILCGLFVYAVGVAGIFRMKYVLNRIHVTASCDTLGTFFVLIGLAVISGFSLTTLKLICILLFIWLTSPISANLLVKAEILGNRNSGEYEVIEK